MFGTITKTLYERFHETSEFQTNISVSVDDSPSEVLGTIVVDLFYNKTYIPIGSFTLHTTIVENENKKTARLCYVDSIELENNLLIQDAVTILTKIQNATAGILKRPEDVLFKFESELTKVGGYFCGLGITDVVYNDSLDCYAKRIDGPLFRVEVITPDHAHRIYDIDIKAINSTSIDVSSTLSENFAYDIIALGIVDAEMTDELKASVQRIINGYAKISKELDSKMVEILVPFYNSYIAKWYATIKGV